jgi:hypothetical protein
MRSGERVPPSRELELQVDQTAQVEPGAPLTVHQPQEWVLAGRAADDDPGRKREKARFCERGDSAAGGTLSGRAGKIHREQLAKIAGDGVPIQE